MGTQYKLTIWECIGELRYYFSRPLRMQMHVDLVDNDDSSTLQWIT